MLRESRLNISIFTAAWSLREFFKTILGNLQGENVKMTVNFINLHLQQAQYSLI